MIKHIIHIGDIHIRNIKRSEETQTILQTFIDECKNVVGENDPSEYRIAILGDLFHQKIDISNESNLLVGWFIRELNNIAKVIVIAGNHDFLLNNKSRVDSITPIFSLSKYENAIYLDKELDYQSGCLVDDNVVWCLYSSFDEFERPNIEETKLEHPDKKYIGLIHTDIVGGVYPNGRITEIGLGGDIFNGLDFVMTAHIHKRQEIKKNGVKIVYCGSLIQQDMGETVTGHGYVLWDVEKNSYVNCNVKNEDYGYFKFTITSEDDIDNDLERILNY